MVRRINIFGGPGSGKSTLACELFAYLKKIGKPIELVNEWIKSWAWQGIKPSGYDQLYTFAKQLRREDLILRSGGLIITDAPILMQAYYAERIGMKQLSGRLVETCKDFDAQYPSLNLLLTRSTTYDPRGRYETEEQAKDIDAGLITLLVEHSVVFQSISLGHFEMLCLIAKNSLES